MDEATALAQDLLAWQRNRLPSRAKEDGDKPFPFSENSYIFILLFKRHILFKLILCQRDVNNNLLHPLVRFLSVYERFINHT